jgi:hypothetical protein
MVTTPSDPISILERMHGLVNAGDLDAVLDGKITSFDVTFTSESIRKLEAAEGQTGASA